MGYSSDLIGCKVTNTKNKFLGIVKDLKNFGAGDLLEIYDEKKKNFFIPMDKNNIVSVDIVNKIIITDPLLGLID